MTLKVERSNNVAISLLPTVVTAYRPGSVIGIATTLRSGLRVPVGAVDFSFLQNVKTGCGAHPTCCSMGSGVLSRGVKSLLGVNNSPPSAVEVKNGWGIILHPLCAFVVWTG